MRVGIFRVCALLRERRRAKGGGTDPRGWGWVLLQTMPAVTFRGRRDTQAILAPPRTAQRRLFAAGATDYASFAPARFVAHITFPALTTLTKLTKAVRNEDFNRPGKSRTNPMGCTKIVLSSQSALIRWLESTPVDEFSFV